MARWILLALLAKTAVAGLAVEEIGGVDLPGSVWAIDACGREVAVGIGDSIHVYSTGPSGEVQAIGAVGASQYWPMVLLPGFLLVTDPQAGFEIRTTDGLGLTARYDVAGGWFPEMAYRHGDEIGIMDLGAGFMTFDLSDPSSPRLLGAADLFPWPNCGCCLACSDELTLAMDIDEEYLGVYDSRNPEAFERLDEIALQEITHSVALGDGWVVVTGQSQGGSTAFARIYSFDDSYEMTYQGQKLVPLRSECSRIAGDLLILAVESDDWNHLAGEVRFIQLAPGFRSQLLNRTVIDNTGQLALGDGLVYVADDTAGRLRVLSWLRSPEAELRTVAGGAMRLDWTAVDGASRYRIETAGNPGGPWSPLLETADTTRVVLPTLGQAFFRVRALSPAGR